MESDERGDALREFAASLMPSLMVNHAVLVVEYIDPETGSTMVSRLGTPKISSAMQAGLLRHAQITTDDDISSAPYIDDDDA